MILQELREKNPKLNVFEIDDVTFGNYGRKITDIDVEELITEGKKIHMPEEGSVYEPSVPAFECLPVAKVLQNKCFGELPIQVGYCYGHSNSLNAWEWHATSEINVAVTDMVLLVADRRELVDGRIDASKAKAFLLREGDVIEVYATTLHFCPCEANDRGFGSVVVLPYGSNTPLEQTSQDKLLFKKNKWLIAHEQNRSLLERGVIAGIFGENYNVLY